MFFLISTISISAENDQKFEHRIVVGYNIGATAPSSIPREIRKIDGWWPQFTPQLGYNIIYKTNSPWQLGSGIMLDYKGMGAREKVKNLYTEIKLEEDGRFLSGYFSGMNEVRIKSAYVTIPLFVRYKINEKWYVRGGGYASYRFSSSFKGEVWNGHMRTPDPTGQEISLENKGDATFDFGSDMRDFDFGILAGGEMKINEKFNLYGNLNWGLSPVFHSSFTPMPFKMYNIYFAIGVAYNL